MKRITKISGDGYFASWGRAADSSLEFALWSISEQRLLVQNTFSGSQHLWDVVVSAKHQRAVLLIREDERFRVEALGFDGSYTRLGTLGFDARRDENGTWVAAGTLDPQAGAPTGDGNRT